ncbi:MAG: hypothetical protein HZB75_03560 [Candidatus Saccharibacteria bacterium]|nr:MAG: hypothetical protein HZB75_03560 [Candidatus Saccharibacteria bacterium]
MRDLLLPLQWVVSGGFWSTLLICLIICPIIPQVVGMLFASYWAPWSPRYQFLSYIPGNPFLALFIAGMSTTLPGGHVDLSPKLNYAALSGAFVAFLVMEWMDMSAYRVDQMRSANKRYHNALYFWYGYLAVACFITMLGTDVSDGRKWLVTAPGIFWVLCLIADNFMSAGAKRRKLAFAHTNNLPLWRTGWRLRRRTHTGYELIG